MSVKRTNPTYYSGDLRVNLVSEALTVIEKQGVAAVSLRKLAKNLGVSHAAPANHFPSKSDLFVEIAKQGFESLTKTLLSSQQRRKTEIDPVNLIERLGLAYLTFAAENPGHFAVMFRTDLIAATLLLKEKAAAFGVLRDAVIRAQESGWRALANTQTLATLLWALVHGFAHLEAEGSFVADQQQRKAVLKLALQANELCSPS